ncbi:hypothetical protein GLAREA_01235 [Glarea lozoyensis ATCC 20868]|uniref:Transmembrane protein n=1 Tax=Glarea lozoyensis (strain ATCC 20868 / MF5171) TaxID=1116229 RepID=S3DFB3_GLAL2|nr:uncharacterized protein GLAREA_01235 [Glarea lozoyensis ATCC 20868]EPE25323.1 hypothetical protein GLAREA_01235 [Glarea lozoyensis ATCC 20868]
MSDTSSPRISFAESASAVALSNYQSAFTSLNNSHHSVPLPLDNSVYYVKVVIHKAKSSFVLSYLAILASSTGEDVFLALRQLYERENKSCRVMRGIRRFFWNTVVETATISNLSPSFLESQNLSVEVLIDTRVNSAEFTAAYQNPSSLHASGPFVLDRPTLITSSPSREVLLLATKLNKRSVAFGIGAAAGMSVCVGIVAGLVWNSGELGVQTATGLLTGISVFGGLLLWISK